MRLIDPHGNPGSLCLKKGPYQAVHARYSNIFLSEESGNEYITHVCQWRRADRSSRMHQTLAWLWDAFAKKHIVHIHISPKMWLLCSFIKLLAAVLYLIPLNFACYCARQLAEWLFRVRRNHSINHIEANSILYIINHVGPQGCISLKTIYVC